MDTRPNPKPEPAHPGQLTPPDGDLFRPAEFPIPMFHLAWHPLRILAANRAAVTVFGPDVEKHFHRLTPEIIQQLPRLVSTGLGPVMFTINHEVRHFQLTALRTAANAQDAWVIAQDVTPGVMFAEHNLRMVTSRYALYSRLALPCWVMDKEGEIIFHNEAFTQQFPVCQQGSAVHAACAADETLRAACPLAPGVVPLVVSCRELAEQVRATGDIAEITLDLGLCGVWQVFLVPLHANDGSAQVAALAVAKIVDSDTIPITVAGVKHVQAQAVDLQTVREQERVSVSRELHDSLGQELTLLRLETRRMLQRDGDTDPAFQRRLVELNDHIQHIMGTLRHLAHELRHDIVRVQGLAGAAAEFVMAFRKRSQLEGQLVVEEGWREPHIEMAQHMYRTLQELLNNVAKHADAQRFSVRLSYATQVFTIAVSDDGVGLPRKIIESPQNGRGVGLLSLRERAAIYNGTVAITTRPTIRGSTIQVMLHDTAAKNRNASGTSITD